MSCEVCTHFGAETDGDFGERFCGYTCSKRPTLANLKSFPFTKKMPCLQIDFWFTEFADLEDGTDEGHARAIALWRKSVEENA